MLICDPVSVMIVVMPAPGITFTAARDPTTDPPFCTDSVPLELPPCADHVFAAVHAYKFAPAGAEVLKKTSPVAHTAGNVVPVFRGFVEPAAVKSTLFAWV